MRISVVVPAFNEEKLIAETLRSIGRAAEAFQTRGWETELIICNNNSTDRTAELAAVSGAKVVFESVNQISRARNSGAAAATGDWLIFVDADSHPSRQLFADVAGQITQGRVMAGGSTVVLDPPSYLAWIGTLLWNFISRSLRLMAGSFIFCEARAFREVGGFSDELFAGEEIDLSSKLKRLARSERKKVIILRRHPLVTSARKMRLYRPSELIWFFIKTVFRRQAVLTSREACHPWYDGRR